MRNMRNIPAARDMLHEKSAEIQRLTQEADNAVSLVTQTISNLEVINQQISDGMDELDAYANELAKTRQTMARARSHNSAIIQNFTRLLSVDGADESPKNEEDA